MRTTRRRARLLFLLEVSKLAFNSRALVLGATRYGGTTRGY